MSRPRLLLVPSFTELEWGILPLLEEWAEVATFDMPGVGEQPAGEELEPQPGGSAELLARWRAAGARLAAETADRRGWERFLVITDGHGAPTAVRLAGERRSAVQALAIGHAALSHSSVGDRAPMRGGAWAALGQLARQGNVTFVRYGIAQMTRGGIDDELAARMVERFPDIEAVAEIVEAIGDEPEPIGEELAALGLPLLLAKHSGCLGFTDEGFDDIVSRFPDADAVSCPEACTSSPAFAEAVRRFCERAVAPLTA